MSALSANDDSVEIPDDASDLELIAALRFMRDGRVEFRTAVGTDLGRLAHMLRNLADTVEAHPEGVNAVPIDVVDQGPR